MPSKTKNEHLKSVSAALLQCIDNILTSKFNITFTQDPVTTEKDIIEYDSLMRTSGLQKFNTACIVSSSSFYLSQKELDDHSALGAIILYLKEDLSERFLKSGGLNLKGDDENIVLDSFGEFCKLLTDELMPKLKSLGYKNLIASPAINQRNNIVQGVEFNYDELKFHEISFHFWKEKALVAEITIAPTG